MMNLRDKEALYTTKEEGDASATTAGPSSSRQWSSAGLKNPRIVRVSRSFGGKDRHSKVCTIKGLRDRRIRLSVPTAIQLYDLQDRLGLGQPSKVIDWLLDITKHDIDKLPPLPAIPGHFQQDTHTNSHQGYGSTSSSNPYMMDGNLFPFRKEGGININNRHQSLDVNEDPLSIVEKFKYWDNASSNASKQKQVDEDDNQGGHSQVLAQNFFPITSGNNSNNPSTYNHHPMYNYYHWEPSNLSLTHQLGNHGFQNEQQQQQQQQQLQGHSPSNSSSIGGLPSPLALSSGSQLFVSPSSMASTSSLFPPPHASYVSNLHPQVENDIRQFNRFHVSNYPFTTTPLYTSNALGLKPFPLSITNHSHLHQNQDDHHKTDDNA